MSNLLNRLEQHIFAHQKAYWWGRLLIESRDELRRLEKENAALKSTLIEIQSFTARRLAQEALRNT